MPDRAVQPIELATRLSQLRSELKDDFRAIAAEMREDLGGRIDAIVEAQRAANGSLARHSEQLERLETLPCILDGRAARAQAHMLDGDAGGRWITERDVRIVWLTLVGAAAVAGILWKAFPLIHKLL